MSIQDKIREKQHNKAVKETKTLVLLRCNS